MKWSWGSFFVYLAAMVVLSFSGTIVASHFVGEGSLSLSEEQEVRMAMSFGSIGAGVILAVVAAMRVWRLSHFFVAVGIVGGLFGGGGSGVVIVLMVTALVYFPANKLTQVVRYYRTPLDDSPSEGDRAEGGSDQDGLDR